MNIKILDASALDTLTTIQRRELVHEAYELKDGTLKVQQVDWNVPDWPLDGSDDFSWRGKFDRWQPLFEEGSVLLGAFDGETLTGFALFRPKLTEKMAQLVELHVDHRHRRKGAGTKLVQECFRLALEGGAAAIYVSSIPTKNTVDFYRKHGFDLIEEVHPELFELEPEDIHMVKALIE